MDPAEPTYAFPAAVHYDAAIDPGYMKHWVPVPEEVAAALEARGVVRLAGRLGEVPFRRSLQRRSGGQPCLRFGDAWLRDAGLAVGDDLWVTLAADPDPDWVELPLELSEALGADPAALDAWELLTPGQRRTLAFGVERVKSTEARRRRALRLLSDLLGGTLGSRGRRRG